MAQKKQKDSYPVVQFRPPKWLDDALQRAAAIWQVSTNEAARRIILLACAGLRPGHHALVEELAKAQGNPTDFAAATQTLFVARILMRPALDYPDMTLPKDDPAARTIREIIDKLKTHLGD